MVDRYVDFGERLPVLKNQIPYDKRSGIANIRCLIISEIYVTQIKWTFPNFISLIIKVQWYWSSTGVVKYLHLQYHWSK